MKITKTKLKEIIQEETRGVLQESIAGALKDKWRKFTSPGDKTGHSSEFMIKKLEEIYEQIYHASMELDAWGEAEGNSDLRKIANNLRGRPFKNLGTVITDMGGEAFSVPHYDLGEVLNPDSMSRDEQTLEEDDLNEEICPGWGDKPTAREKGCVEGGVYCSDRAGWVCTQRKQWPKEKSKGYYHGGIRRANKE